MAPPIAAGLVLARGSVRPPTSLRRVLARAPRNTPANDTSWERPCTTCLVTAAASSSPRGRCRRPSDESPLGTLAERGTPTLYLGHSPKCVGPARSSSLLARISRAIARPTSRGSWLLNWKWIPPTTRDRPASLAAAEKLG